VQCVTGLAGLLEQCVAEIDLEIRTLVIHVHLPELLNGDDQKLGSVGQRDAYGRYLPQNVRQVKRFRAPRKGVGARLVGAILLSNEIPNVLGSVSLEDLDTLARALLVHDEVQVPGYEVRDLTVGHQVDKKSTRSCENPVGAEEGTRVIDLVKNLLDLLLGEDMGHRWGAWGQTPHILMAHDDGVG
jgi:hypothetical protein